jgi:hypothetical protein
LKNKRKIKKGKIYAVLFGGEYVLNPPVYTQQIQRFDDGIQEKDQKDIPLKITV